MARQPTKTTESPPTPPTTGTELTTTGSKAVAALSTELEDDLLALAGAGAEMIGSEDRQIPFVRIIQSLSPQKTRGKPEYVQGIEEGDFFHTVSQEFWKGEDGVYVVPISYMRNHTEWWPRNSPKGKGLVANHGNSALCLERTERGEKGENMTPEGTIISVTGDYFCFLLRPKQVGDGQLDWQDAEWEPIVLSFGGTQGRKARQWNTRLTSLRIRIRGQSIQPPLFYNIWHMRSQPESNDRGAWMGWKIDLAMPVYDLNVAREIFQDAKSFLNLVAENKVRPADPVDPVYDEAHDGDSGQKPARQEVDENDVY